MNDFLTSVFPRAYAKIYNGMIQLNGSSFVSKYTSNKEDMDPNKYIEKYATQRPSDQVYDALKCVYETNKAGYPQLLLHLKNDPGSFQMRKMSAVLSVHNFSEMIVQELYEVVSYLEFTREMKIQIQ